MSDDKFSHLRALPRVLEVDRAMIEKKDREYGASWKKRGGVGAFMMLARKWDRLEEMMANRYGWDIFRAIEYSRTMGDGSALDQIRDLRCYLALVESEMVARGIISLLKPTSLAHGTEVWFKSDKRWIHGMITQIETLNDSYWYTVSNGVNIWRVADSDIVLERPGTPEDGGQHAAEDEGETIPVPTRQPFMATDKEFSDIADIEVTFGSMKGRKWRELYESTVDTEGRHRMMFQYTEEYGQ